MSNTRRRTIKWMDESEDTIEKKPKKVAKKTGAAVASSSSGTSAAVSSKTDDEKLFKKKMLDLASILNVKVAGGEEDASKICDAVVEQKMSLESKWKNVKEQFDRTFAAEQSLKAEFDKIIVKLQGVEEEKKIVSDELERRRVEVDVGTRRRCHLETLLRDETEKVRKLSSEIVKLKEYYKNKVELERRRLTRVDMPSLVEHLQDLAAHQADIHAEINKVVQTVREASNNLSEATTTTLKTGDKIQDGGDKNQSAGRKLEEAGSKIQQERTGRPANLFDQLAPGQNSAPANQPRGDNSSRDPRFAAVRSDGTKEDCRRALLDFPSQVNIPPPIFAKNPNTAQVGYAKNTNDAQVVYESSRDAVAKLKHSSGIRVIPGSVHSIRQQQPANQIRATRPPANQSFKPNLMGKHLAYRTPVPRGEREEAHALEFLDNRKNNWMENRTTTTEEVPVTPDAMRSFFYGGAETVAVASSGWAGSFLQGRGVVKK